MGLYNHKTMTIDNVEVIVGKRIDFLRGLMGITQEELAKKIGVTQSAVCSWEVGRAIPSAKKIDDIVKAFGVTRSQFNGTEKIVWQQF